MRSPSSPKFTVSNPYPFGRVFGNKLIVENKGEEIQIDLNNIYKVRLYSTYVYLYNIILLLAGVAIFAAGFLYLKSMTMIAAAVVIALVPLYYAFRLKIPKYSIVITLKKHKELISIKVGKHQCKLADDFIFYVNGEILKQDKRLYNRSGFNKDSF